jgi:hypothetical protein
MFAAQDRTTGGLLAPIRRVRAVKTFGLNFAKI